MALFLDGLRERHQWREILGGQIEFHREGAISTKNADLLHAATMQNHGVTRILSVDLDFDQIEGLRRMDPQAFYELRDRS